MVKRKGSSNGDTKSTKKVKKVSESNNNSEECYDKINCTSPESVMSSLLGSDQVDTFFKSHWEQKPLHIKRRNSGFYGDMFSLVAMKDLLKNHELQFQSDVNVCRYVNNEKELLNEEGKITPKKFGKLMKDQQATFQIHQPQRYSDNLWNIMEKMETYFGNLVGSNVYITPASSQGLAPHCDDVEIFVLQLEGKKTWKLYDPMVKLSRDYTQDLLQDTIGEPVFEETLEPGDLLYFPRGTVHQAKTTDDGHSLHISISTYQQNTWGDFMNHAVSQAIEAALEDDVTFRSGLPLKYLSFLGTGKDMDKYVELVSGEVNEIKNRRNKRKSISNHNDERVKEFKKDIKNFLSKLMDHIDVNAAADSMSADFMASRLPPHKHVIKEDNDANEKVPTIEDKIKIKYPAHVRVVYSNDDDSNGDLSQLDEDSDMEDDTEPEEAAGKNAEKRPKSDTENKAAPQEEKSCVETITSLNTDEKLAAGDVKSDPKTEDKTKANGLNEDEDDGDDDDDDEADPQEEAPCIQILHSLNNVREEHMSGDSIADFAGVLKLPVHFGPAAVALLESNDYVAVKDFMLHDDDDKVLLATTLYADDLIETQS